jgi:hemerythrin
MNERKKQLITDIQNLLNSYDAVKTTSINPSLLEFMDENTLVSIIDSLLAQKENHFQADEEWLEKFKKDEYDN